MKEIKDMPEAEKIMEIPISYEEKGKEIGRKEGIKEGIKEGKQEGIIQVAIEMLKEGASIDFISKVTRLEKKKIEDLKKRI